jgi:hypothetical protein
MNFLGVIKIPVSGGAPCAGTDNVDTPPPPIDAPLLDQTRFILNLIISRNFLASDTVDNAVFRRASLTWISRFA